jgi:hypothetical protein
VNMPITANDRQVVIDLSQEDVILSAGAGPNGEPVLRLQELNGTREVLISFTTAHSVTVFATMCFHLLAKLMATTGPGGKPDSNIGGAN